jgi:hypothetical protein
MNKKVNKFSKISKIFFINAICISTVMPSNYIFANLPVVDAAAIAQMVQQYQQLVQVYQEMKTSSNYLGQLNSDSLKWMSPEFSRYFNGLNNLSTQVEKVNSIISSSTFNNLYPGYDGIAVKNYEKEFRNRSESLLKVISNQIEVANQALANQKDINNADKSSAAAVANLTLASLSNLNMQMASEIKIANAFRANQIQNDVDKKNELKRFIGEPYKKHNKYKSCMGEC